MAKEWPAIERRLQELRMGFSVRFTQHRGHAMRLTDDAILNGHRYILGIGGDGLHHEISNGILAQQYVPSTDITYALLPLGMGNDWARQYGITSDINARLEQLKAPVTRLQDAGKVTYTDLDGRPASRFFVNVAGMAYDAYVVKRLDETGKSSNKFLYLLAAFRFLMDYQPQAARIDWDGGAHVEDEFYTVNIGICKYSGGGMQFVPQAIPDDRLLALTFARKLPKYEVLLQTPRFYNGKLLEHPRLTGVQTRELRVTPRQSEMPFYLEADGELLGTAPAVFTVLDRPLKFVV